MKPEKFEAKTKEIEEENEHYKKLITSLKIQEEVSKMIDDGSYGKLEVKFKPPDERSHDLDEQGKKRIFKHLLDSKFTEFYDEICDCRDIDADTVLKIIHLFNNPFVNEMMREHFRQKKNGGRLVVHADDRA